MSFSRDEKERAAKSHEIHIANFQGVFGDVSGSQVTQNFKMEIGQGDFSSVRSVLSSSGIEDADIEDLQRALTEEPVSREQGKYGPQVSAWMGKMISKAASGTWEISAGAAGGLLANVIGAYYGLGS